VTYRGTRSHSLSIERGETHPEHRTTDSRIVPLL
jgi:hypothetical protein